MTEIATLSGGCFWCTEALFKRLKGVESVIPGYAGGTVKNPNYEQVCSGTTGYTEAIQIIFDPNTMPYEKLLDIFWHIHNPTTINRQGNDIGTQYRSVIYYHDDNQKKKALGSKKSMEEEKLYTDPVVTDIVPYTTFYPAENYHKDYYDKNKNSSYCSVVIDPKIHKLLVDYKKDVKEDYV